MAGPYETTLAAACAENDRQLVLASASNVAIGQQVRVDGELFQVTKGYVSGSVLVPVLRGLQGTVAQAHGNTARVVFGLASEFAQSTPPQVTPAYPIAGRARVVVSYGASGAIALPPAGSDALALLNGTNALAMTLAAPSKDIDGSVLTVAGTGVAAHTVTMTGFSGGSLTVATFDAAGVCNFSVMAMDEKWVPYPSPLSGTLTSIDVAMS